jgi:apolipoprotein N-acyltransferase
MITLGLVLMILGLLVGAPILWTLGIILLVVGLVLLLLGRTGRQVGGRAHYW